MPDSINLMHFPDHDPPTTTAKQCLRSKLQEDIDKYLSTGGAIQDVGNKSGIIYTAKRSRKDQIDFIRNRDYVRRTKQ